MVKRKQEMVSFKVYVFTFILTVIIFSLGLLLGVTLENERQRIVHEDLVQYQSDLENIMLQEALIEGDSMECESFPLMFKDLYKNLDNMGETLEDYQARGKFHESEFEKLKVQYTTLSIRTWLLMEKVRKSCPGDLSTILYFYSSKSCRDCLSQGVVLDAIKKEYGMRVMIFPIDKDLEHPGVHSLSAYFNVTTAPTLVVNSRIKHEGLTDKEVITPELFNATQGE